MKEFFTQYRSGFIQVAGVRDFTEAQCLERAGVDAIGFPLKLGYHQPDLDTAEAAAIVRALSERVRCVVITYHTEAEEIIDLCHVIGTRWVQIHGDISLKELRRLRKRRPKFFIIKSLIVKGDNYDLLMEQIRGQEKWVDAFITDTFDHETGACGATGKTHDWLLSSKLTEHTMRPVILAGGLKPGNVGRAIKVVRPAGVDVHTGVENLAGKKDPILVRAFVAEARRAFRQLRTRSASPPT